MKIKDLPKDYNLQSVKVRLPKKVFNASSLPQYGLKNTGVYLQGWVMGDFFVKVKKESTQIYPMFWGVSGIPSNFEEWEVLEK